MVKPSAGRSPLPIRDAIGSCMGAASSPEQGVGAGFVGEILEGNHGFYQSEIGYFPQIFS